MRDFDPAPLCEKCGYDDFHWKHISFTRVYISKLNETSEHLQLTCKRCEAAFEMCVMRPSP